MAFGSLMEQSISIKAYLSTIRQKLLRNSVFAIFIGLKVEITGK